MARGFSHPATEAARPMTGVVALLWAGVAGSPTKRGTPLQSAKLGPWAIRAACTYLGT
jgi:hypothetical protein